MAESPETARAAAKILLDIEAILFRPDQPFVFTSGRASPVYVDCRRIISFPKARSRLMDMGVELIQQATAADPPDVIAGGETAGIPFAAWIAERLGLPMIYVRKKPKGFGRNAQIEGTFHEGAKVLLVEDLATDGGSKVKFIEALRGAGAEISETFVIFHYDIFPQSTHLLADLGVNLRGLCTWWDALALVEDIGYLDAGGVAEVRAFLEAPDAWSAAHGGKTSEELAAGG